MLLDEDEGSVPLGHDGRYKYCVAVGLGHKLLPSEPGLLAIGAVRDLSGQISINDQCQKDHSSASGFEHVHSSTPLCISRSLSNDQGVNRKLERVQ